MLNGSRRKKLDAMRIGHFSQVIFNTYRIKKFVQYLIQYLVIDIKIHNMYG